MTYARSGGQRLTSDNDKQLKNISKNLEEFVLFSRVQQDLLLKFITFLKPLGLYYEFKNERNINQITVLNQLEEIISENEL